MGMVPVAVVVATTWMTSLASCGIEAKVRSTRPGATRIAPLVAETKLRVGSSVSWTTTLVATAGPRLVTVMV